MILLVIASSEGFAQEGNIFRNGVDARALSMGGAFVAVADNYSAVYWNPAGMALLHGFSLGGMYTNWFSAGINFAFLGGVFPFHLSIGPSFKFHIAAGGAISYASITDIPLASGELGGSSLEQLSIMAGTVGVDIAFVRIFLSGSMKTYSYTLTFPDQVWSPPQRTDFSQGLLIDIGEIFFVGVADRIGAALKLGDVFVLAMSQETLGGEVGWRWGLEFKPSALIFGKGTPFSFSTRAGMMQLPALSQQPSFTAGIGLRYWVLAVDFAWLQNNFLVGEGAGDTWVLSAELIF